jgi:hypothetical protein
MLLICRRPRKDGGSSELLPRLPFQAYKAPLGLGSYTLRGLLFVRYDSLAAISDRQVKVIVQCKC